MLAPTTTILYLVQTLGESDYHPPLGAEVVQRNVIRGKWNIMSRSNERSPLISPLTIVRWQRAASSQLRQNAVRLVRLNLQLH
jgi:hypothetical protein